MSSQDTVCPNGHSSRGLILGINETESIKEGATRIIDRKTTPIKRGALAILVVIIFTGIYISLNSSGWPAAINGGFLAFLSIISGYYGISKFHFRDRETVKP